MVMMKMNAMESLKDKNMLYLDIVSGVLGVFLYVMLRDGYKNFKLDKKMLPYMLTIILSRVIVDFVYYHAVSKTEMFGGSTKELAISTVVWFAMVYMLSRGKMKPIEMGVLFACLSVVLLAVAKVTNWG